MGFPLRVIGSNRHFSTALTASSPKSAALADLTLAFSTNPRSSTIKYNKAESSTATLVPILYRLLGGQVNRGCGGLSSPTAVVGSPAAGLFAGMIVGSVAETPFHEYGEYGDTLPESLPAFSQPPRPPMHTVKRVRALILFLNVERASDLTIGAGLFIWYGFVPKHYRSATPVVGAERAHARSVKDGGLADGFHEKACREFSFKRFTFFLSRFEAWGARRSRFGQASIRTRGGGVNRLRWCRRNPRCAGKERSCFPRPRS
jgi:hypothetical protein